MLPGRLASVSRRYRSIYDVPKPLLEGRARGCLLGGAIGDALGAPVEFLPLAQIRARYGPEGIRAFDRAYGVVGAITDDTQMTLFTAEGIVRAWVRGGLRGVCHGPTVVSYAYQRWLVTQGEECDPFVSRDGEGCDGWLIKEKGLHARRAPGTTCLAALRVARHGCPAKNDSKGCGAVMRSAPWGFFHTPWEMAWDCAALTHGHVEAKASSAIFAQAVHNLALGGDLREALLGACAMDPDGTLSAMLLERAVELAAGDMPPEDAIRSLGEGWVGEEALAIGAFCALRAEGDFEGGVRLAVNHDGDSDSTGSICGNLLGTLLGVDALPGRWLEQLELRDVIDRIARDLVVDPPITISAGIDAEERRAQAEFCERYPGW